MEFIRGTLFLVIGLGILILLICLIIAPFKLYAIANLLEKILEELKKK